MYSKISRRMDLCPTQSRPGRKPAGFLCTHLPWVLDDWRKMMLEGTFNTMLIKLISFAIFTRGPISWHLNRCTHRFTADSEDSNGGRILQGPHGPKCVAHRDHYKYKYAWFSCWCDHRLLTNQRKHELDSTYAGRNDQQWSVDPHRGRPVTQPVKKKEGNRWASCFSWQKLVFVRNHLWVEQTWMRWSVTSVRSTATENWHPICRIFSSK